MTPSGIGPAIFWFVVPQPTALPRALHHKWY